MILSKLKAQLQRRYGDEWVELEPETISLDLGVTLDPLSVQSIQVLQAITRFPERFLEDASYFLGYVEATNNKLIDPEHGTMPTSLELAWSLVEMEKLVEKFKASEMIRKVCIYLLREEGYSEPLFPFSFLKDDDFYDGQSARDTANKAKAIRMYIAAQEKTGGKA